MVLQLRVSPDLVAGRPGIGEAFEIHPDVACLRLPLVNVVLIGRRGGGDRGFVLVDAGLRMAEGMIVRACAKRFGADARPAAIVLTHGHFDHVGALASLAERWDAPVFAHPAEAPFLRGERSYPRADAAAGGGLMTLLSPLMPHGPVDVSRRLVELSPDGAVPFLDGWTWIATPGHAPGHVALWNRGTGVLVAGDAFVTTGQESAIEVLRQTPELHGPPRYFTPDWVAAEASVATLAALPFQAVATGHGPPLRGPGLPAALKQLLRRFRAVAVPPHRRVPPR
jgi:glyoxylase-like metal-dependent hydrolase (beta-lactamase superfamily II)